MNFDHEIEFGSGMRDVLDTGFDTRGAGGLQEAHYDTERKISLALGVFCSLLLHAALAAVFLAFNIDTLPTEDNRIPSMVQIRLVPNNPQTSENEDQTVIEESVESELAKSVVEDEIFEDGTQEQLADKEGVTEQIVDIEQDILRDEPQEALIELLETPHPYMPSHLWSVDAIRQSAETLESERRSRIYTYECNVLEEEAGIRDCEPNDARDYGLLERNSVYDRFRPMWERSRSKKALAVVATHSADVAKRLNGIALPAGLSAYLMAEMEAGIEVYSNEGNTRLQNMEKFSALVRKDGVAALAEKVMGGPGVKSMISARRARRYRGL